MIEDVIDQIRETCEGLTADDIAMQLESCANVAPEDVPRLAAYFAALNA